MRFRDICLWLLVAWCSLVVLVECQYRAPINTVRRGFRDRVEYIKADIQRQHLDTGTPTNPATRAYARRMGTRNDDAGHLIAQRLGGTGRDTYNIVPQNKGINRGSWRARVERPIYDDVRRGNTVIFQIWPKYSTSRATRPHALEYVATRPNGSIVLRRATHPNPPSRPRRGRIPRSSWTNMDFQFPNFFPQDLLKNSLRETIMYPSRFGGY